MRRTLIFSILDQAALSAFNFALAFFLIRYWAKKPEVFGIYSIVLAGSLTLMSVQNALVIGHLTVLRPKAAVKGDESALLSMFWTVNAAVTVGAILITFSGVQLTQSEPNAGFAVGAALFVGATLLREYTRCYHFSRLNVRAVLALDAISLLLSVVLIATACTLSLALDLGLLFAILALSQTVASVAAIIPDRQDYRLVLTRETAARYSQVWRHQSGWALLGVMTSEFQQRGYVFVVALVFGAGGVALLQAAALLFRPIQLIVHAWGKLARAVLAEHFAKDRITEARRFTRKSFVGLIGLYIAFLAVLTAGWPFIRDRMFQGHYAGLESVAILWSVATAAIMTTGIFSVEAQSLGKFRQLSYGAALGAVACGIVLGGVVVVGDLRGSILAVIAGQLVFLAFILRILSQTHRTYREAAAKEARAFAIALTAGGHEGAVS